MTRDHDHTTRIHGPSDATTASRRRELTPGSFGRGRDISHTVVIKDKDLFFLTEPDGRVPAEPGHGFGLFYHDCRYLSGYEIRIGQQTPEHLVWHAETGYMAIIALTNPEFVDSAGATIGRHSIGIRWVRVIDGSQLALHDVFTFQNLTVSHLDFTFSMRFLSAFEDLFEIRGLTPKQRGVIEPPRWVNNLLDLSYRGADGVYRSVIVQFSRKPAEIDGSSLAFDIVLKPNESTDRLVSLTVRESRDRAATRPRPSFRLEPKAIEPAAQKRSNKWIQGITDIYTSSISLNKSLKRSMVDLDMLRSYIGKEEYFAAGVPWFAALFGRDSIITALQMLAFDCRIAEHTILLLAALQGKRTDPWRDEQPGKILHELRVGEMANLNEVPHTPYYGTVDATPLFLILIARHAAWSGELALFNTLRQNIDAALNWISNGGDISKRGYLEYQRNTAAGLENQGWKDSGDGIVNSDGSLATPPIALVEVQAYVYLAKVEMAELYRRAGEQERAHRLEAEAEDLKQRFNRDFWVEDGFYALALQNDGQQAAVMSSNAGHALWAGIATPDCAAQTVERLMSEDMFNGWGIRTLSERERRYNPLGYHLGTVWPHDNSLIVGGLRNYGYDKEAIRVFVALLDAATFFDAHRLPELFAGFSKNKFGVPVNYPVACQPQSWAAGTIPYMFKTLLGLWPQAFENRLLVRRPILPDFINEVDIEGLRVGTANVDLKFERTFDTIAVKVLRQEGRLDVVVEL